MLKEETCPAKPIRGHPHDLELHSQWAESRSACLKKERFQLKKKKKNSKFFLLSQFGVILMTWNRIRNA